MLIRCSDSQYSSRALDSWSLVRRRLRNRTEMGNDVNCCQALDTADAADCPNMLCIVDLANGWPLIRGFRSQDCSLVNVEKRALCRSCRLGVLRKLTSFEGAILRDAVQLCHVLYHSLVAAWAQTRSCEREHKEPRLEPAALNLPDKKHLQYDEQKANFGNNVGRSDA